MCCVKGRKERFYGEGEIDDFGKEGNSFGRKFLLGRVEEDIGVKR